MKKSPSTLQIFIALYALDVVAIIIMNRYFGANTPTWFLSIASNLSIIALLVTAKCLSFLLATDRKAASGTGVTVAALIVSATGLNVGLFPQAGDTPVPQIRWVAGLCMFCFGMWVLALNRNVSTVNPVSRPKKKKGKS